MPVTPESVRVVRVFVSSPGDVAQEREVLDEVVAAINRTDGQAGGFRLELFRWEESVAPRIGPRAQKVIDAQTPVYDIYLGLMATRFGTPTGRYGSGTEQEFKAALRQWKRAGSPWITFYFHDRPPLSSDPAQVEQYLKVCQFRQELEALGLVGTYRGVRGSADGFYEQASEHLRKIVRHLAPEPPTAQTAPARSAPSGDSGKDDLAAARAIYITGGQTTVVIQPNGTSSPSEQPIDPAPYLQALRDRTSHIDIRGLQVGSGRAPRFPIEELYIPLTTSGGAAPAEVHASACSEQGAGAEDSLKAGLQRGERFEGRTGRVQLREALQYQRLVIVGDPGAGKSTLLRRIAYLVCDATLKQDATRTRAQLGLDQPLFPILVRVAELSDHIAATRDRPDAPSTDNSPGWLPHYLAQASDEADLGLGEAFFRQRLECGDALVLLDGLDEAPTEAHRKAFAALLENTTSRYGRCRYVLTGRPTAFTDELVFPGFAHVEIDPLEDAAIETFLRRWCQALFADHAAEAERHLAELLDALRSRIEIRRMARNPVMLTALAVVHWNEKRLPEQRADLYESILGWLSRARMQRPGRPTPERCVGLLQDLALAMQDHAEGRQVQVPRHWAAETLAPYWRELPESQRLDAARRFLADEELDSGIIVGRGDYVRYWHLTFQEYLAARALAARSEAEQQTVLLAQPKLYAAEWKEVVLLTAGVLYHQGIKRVDRMISIVLDQLGRSPQLADQAMCVGLLGAAVRDLAPMKYETGDGRYQQLLRDVMQIFEPDWLALAQRRHGGLWSRLVGIVSAQRSQTALIRLAIQAADVLGQAGVADYAPGELDKAWVTIPAGTFWMGAQKTESDGRNYDAEAWGAESNWNESPVHEVELGTFRLARFPVTVGQYQRFVDAGAYADERWWKAGGFGDFPQPDSWEEQLQYPARPLVGVSWFEAAAYAVWAGCRLPTEAEWERAARGTDGRKYPWGNEPADESRLNFAWRYDKPNVGHPTPVGIYPLGVTPEGICDLAGNVWEWCADWHGEYPAEMVAEPRGPAGGTDRVVRGGSWGLVAQGCRAAGRYGLEPQYRGGSLGFRLAAVHPR